MADVIYLTVWQITDPMTRIVREFSEEVGLGTNKNPDYVRLRNYKDTYCIIRTAQTSFVCKQFTFFLPFFIGELISFRPVFMK